MKIIITADTHMPRRSRTLPSRLIDACEAADLIIHAGDWSSMDVYHQLSAYAKTEGVHGNVDDDEIIRTFPAAKIIEAAGCRIGIVHGHGEKKTTEQRAFDAFADQNVQIIVFGHSHLPLIRHMKGRMLINPGSPTDRRRMPYFSFAVLHIEEDIRAELIFFTEKD